MQGYPRTKASPTQISTLLEYMKNTPIHRRPGQNDQQKANIEASWERITAKLNSMGPATKTVFKWKQAWRDLRGNLKKKEASNQSNGPTNAGNNPQTGDQVVSIIDPMEFYEIDEASSESTDPVHESTPATKPEIRTVVVLPLPSHPENGDPSPAVTSSQKLAVSAQNNCGSKLDKQIDSSESDNEDSQIVTSVKFEHLDPLSANFDEKSVYSPKKTSKLWKKQPRVDRALKVKRSRSQYDDDDDEEDDEKFLLSFRSNMKRLNNRQKLDFKIGMLQLIKQITHDPDGV